MAFFPNLLHTTKPYTYRKCEKSFILTFWHEYLQSFNNNRIYRNLSNSGKLTKCCEYWSKKKNEITDFVQLIENKVKPVGQSKAGIRGTFIFYVFYVIIIIYQHILITLFLYISSIFSEIFSM